MTLADIENAPSAVELDWLLEIHARHLKAQQSMSPGKPSATGTGTVTRPLPLPGEG